MAADVEASMLPDLSQNFSNEQTTWEEIMQIKAMPIPMSQKKQLKDKLQVWKQYDGTNYNADLFEFLERTKFPFARLRTVQMEEKKNCESIEWTLEGVVIKIGTVERCSEENRR